MNGGNEQELRKNANKRTLRVLALHGSGNTAPDFQQRLERWRDPLLSFQEEQRTQKEPDGASQPLVEMEIRTVQAPFIKDGGYCWWTMPVGFRSFNATAYEGFETSAELVMKRLINSVDGNKEGVSSAPVDLVWAHSQGAILTTALLAQGKIKQHPSTGYILNGVAWPNPYTKDLEQLQLSTRPECANGGAVAPCPPRVLMLVGERDRINSPEQAERVSGALERAGFDVSVVRHAGGHSVPLPTGPTGKDGALTPTGRAVIEWILHQLQHQGFQTLREQQKSDSNYKCGANLNHSCD